MTRPYILSVDDEELNQMLIEELFDDIYDIELVADGQQCLDTIAKKIPDLILLDIDMPILNGIETCKIIRANTEYKNIPVIFVSAMATPKDIEYGYSMGCNEYITKPYLLSELEEKIKVILEKKN